MGNLFCFIGAWFLVDSIMLLTSRTWRHERINYLTRLDRKL